MPKSNFLNMNKLPKSPKFDTHVWVDFVELLCLVNLDRNATKGDVLDRVRTLSGDLPEGVDPDADETPDDGLLDSVAPAEINDRWSGYADEWFQHLFYRSKAFHDAYPFTLVDTADVLQLKDNLTVSQKLYLFLLLCANLRYCMEFEPDLTAAFEQLSKEAMKSYFSEKAEVHIFGTSETGNRRYSGNLYKKIVELAKDLRDKVVVEEASLPASDTGDGGLDIVSWVSMGDSNSHRIVAFGQCACTEEWDIKQFSSNVERWRGFMSLRSGVTNVLFIPHCLRGSDGEWHRPADISSVMVDRQRFLYSLANQENLLEAKPAYQVVQKAIGQREDIY